MNNIHEIKEKIDAIKEYLETEICQKCQEMSNLLKECEKLIMEYSQSSGGDH